MIVATENQLGPAQVTRIEGSYLDLKLQDRSVRALLALSYPYHPAVGDVVLAIGQEEAFYVIGVIQGRGKTTFTAPGDLEFQAPRGRIDFAGAKGVNIRGGDVSIQAQKLEINARTVLEKFTDACRWVRNAFRLRARTVRQDVDEKYSVVADRILEVAEKDVKIDGSEINLG